jgi:hypothetical protein
MIVDNRVRLRRLDRRADHINAPCAEHLIERATELRLAVAHDSAEVSTVIWPVALVASGQARDQPRDGRPAAAVPPVVPVEPQRREDIMRRHPTAWCARGRNEFSSLA